MRQNELGKNVRRLNWIFDMFRQNPIRKFSKSKKKEMFILQNYTC